MQAVDGTRRSGELWLVLATGLAASLPVIVAVVGAVADRWVPLADNAVIVLRSWDVFTAQSPLVGQYSIATADAVGDVYSPGPLLYWLLAVPVRVFGIDSVPVTLGLVNVASIVGAVALARRRGGLVFMFVAAIALALMCRSLSPAILYTPFNPTAPLIPCTLLVFLAWSLACGEYRLLPLAVLVASFVMQTHLAYVIPALGSLAVGGIGLLITRPAHSRRWLVAALLVGIACWSAPLIDEIVHEPGNLTMLGRTLTAERTTLGASAGWHAAVRAFGAPPWWLRSDVGDGARFADMLTDPSRPSILAFLALVGLLAAVAVLCRRRREVVSAAVLGLVLIGALAALAAATPVERVITLGYTMQWGSPAGMFAWLAAALGVLAVLAPVRRFEPRGSGVLVAGLVLALAAGVWASADREPYPNRSVYEPARRIASELESKLPRDRTVFLEEGGGEVGYLSYPFLVYSLRRDGYRVLVVPRSVESMGSYYGVTKRRYDISVRLVEADKGVVNVVLGPGGVGRRR